MRTFITGRAIFLGNTRSIQWIWCHICSLAFAATNNNIQRLYIIAPDVSYWPPFLLRLALVPNERSLWRSCLIGTIPRIIFNTSYRAVIILVLMNPMLLPFLDGRCRSKPLIFHPGWWAINNPVIVLCYCYGLVMHALLKLVLAKRHSTSSTSCEDIRGEYAVDTSRTKSIRNGSR